MRALLLLLPLLAPQDTDGDGLSDFHELHKYRTDPAAPDSDGDGTPDGEWFERREYTYTVRSVVQVMPPVTGDVLRDDYQDARVLDRGPEHVELEVIHYPLATAAETIAPDPDWRETVADMEEYLRPGPSSNWDGEMRAELVAALAGDGIDVDELDDVQIVREVSSWALARTEHTGLFTTFCHELGPDGEVRPHPDLADHVEREAREAGLELDEALRRELFARGMFAHRTRGSCTSSAIYLNGVLRAVGIPTRIVLMIPVVDASDERERKMVHRLGNPDVRATIRAGTFHLRGSWASHTMNEVFVGGRWRRLNYTNLGQGVLDPGCFGLMTHVATVSDWLEGGFAATVGRRQVLRRGAPDLFGFQNPYSCISLADRYGAHSGLQAPEPELEVRTVKALHWADDPGLPAFVREALDGSRLLIETAEDETWPELKDFLAFVDPVLFLESPGAPTLTVRHATGGFSNAERRFVVVRLQGAGRDELAPEAAYTLRPRNREASHRWRVAPGVALRR